MVITANNSPFVIWSKATTPKAIRGRKWNGTAFGNAVDLVTSDLMPTGFIGPEVAAKGDTVYLIFESLLHSNHVIYLKKSFDGGLTFSDTIRVSENSNTNYFFMPNVAVTGRWKSCNFLYGMLSQFHRLQANSKNLF